MPHDSSDSDTEEDKLRQRQMRESVEHNSFAVDAYKKVEPILQPATAEGASAAAAASSAAAVSSAASTAAASFQHAHNPFYALLHPPVPPFFSLACPAVPERLKANKYRVGFLARIDQQIRDQKQQLERRRRNGLHGLQSNRNSSGEEGALAATGARVLNAFEQSMLRSLLAMVERGIDIEEGVWREETQQQKEARAQAYQLSRQFVVFRRFPPGSFLDFLEANDSNAGAKSAADDAADEEVDRKRRKAERKARKALAAADGDTPMTHVAETDEQRRARKAAKKEKKRQLEEAGGGGADDASKKAKKQKKETTAAE